MMRGTRLLGRIAAALALAASGPTPRAVAAGPAYGEVQSVADLDRIFAAIRADVAAAQSRAELTRLYRRAGYLVTLTYSRPWRVKFGDALPGLRDDAKRQFASTVAALNHRATEIGAEADYTDRRGDP